MALAIVFFCNNTLKAQRNCGSMENLERLQSIDPQIKTNIDAIERHTQEYIQKPHLHTRTVVSIPVVVHVLYNITEENISDAQIQSQIDVLNKDFRKLNSDIGSVPTAFAGLAADSEVEFCLATVDPNGATTTGITRTSTTKTSFGTDDKMKYTAQGGKDAWNTSKYLNLWVCDLGTSLLGYAQFPGGSAATDGVVIHYKYFGTIGTATAPYHKGRTATHEIGHWLNLRHIWGDANCGSDLVSDTPTQQTSNYGCPSYPHVTCSNGTNGDMFMNYMDYTDDACMYMFSTGQKTRMQSLFAAGGARASLLTSNGCSGGTTPPPATCNTPTGLASSNITATGATVSWAAVSGAISYNLQYQTSTSTTWTTYNTTSTSAVFTNLTSSTTYNYQVQAVCSTTSTSTYSAASSFATLSGGGGTGTCTENNEANNSKTAAKTLTLASNLLSQISTSTDVDWFKFSNTSSKKNIKVSLTTLPGDYDMYLYKGNSLVGYSENSDFNDETIVYNTTSTATTYYLKIVGWNGAYSNTNCYTLRADISASTFKNDGTDQPEPVITLNDLQKWQGGNSALNVYPNPATNAVNILFEAQQNEPATIQIVDVLGKLVTRQNFETNIGINEFNFDTQNVPAGIYFVKLQAGKTQLTQKLLIVK